MCKDNKQNGHICQSSYCSVNLSLSNDLFYFCKPLGLNLAMLSSKFLKCVYLNSIMPHYHFYIFTREFKTK